MRILCVEGNKTFRSILEQQLVMEGLHCHCLSNGGEGLYAARQLLFDFVCVSLFPDDMQATHFIQQLRKIPGYQHTPIVLFTSEYDEKSLTEVLKAGATEVFHRHAVEELVTFIRRYNSRYEPLNGSVLYVEDSLVQQQTVSHILGSVGLDVLCVASAEEGWERFQQNTYDLLIVDVVLTGDMSGIRLVNNVRRQCGDHGDVPILAVSAYDEPSRRIELLNRGANDYVCKPVLQDELIARVRGLIGQKRLLEQVRSEQAQTLHRFEFLDSATELPNRKMLLQILEQEMARAVKHKYFSALLYVDLDSFRAINDTMGYQVGDALLRKVAQRLARIKRREDSLASLGGDDYALVLSEISDDGQLAADYCRGVADQIQKAVARPFEIDGKLVHTEVTVGMVLFPVHQTSSLEVLRQGESAFEQARYQSANRVSFFSSEMQKQAEKRFTLQTALRHALRHHQLDVYYQPIFGPGKQLLSLEALSRWCHNGEMVPPDLFINVAEECGLIHELGDWVMGTVAGHVHHWQQLGLPESFEGVAINISPYQLLRERFSLHMLKRIEELGLRSNMLKIEITENALIANVERTSKQLERLRGRGVHVALDDFGIGYSSLSYLQGLPVDQLKIDRSFVWNMHDNAAALAIVQTIISMGKALSMQVVAEGVETREQMERLVAMGCHGLQGFFLQTPMTLAATEQFLQARQLPIARPRA
ncbi:MULTISPECIES: EAL domain-containing protein [unclassified Ketobacter]|uniref:EAL domain-containing response regulator n=1 Tax=unclassified Ketobacter TaxID=2639109 RepID=UPI000F134776|nr:MULTISPECIES: EAL domain-containing protein [unclassified Ketobacter]RLT91150.1 MAG: EAL domain-containing protein [Ketobacter sp. GenoA1]RLT98415.1 MAG: EAL domain-containing protein [Ketobacter sp.]